MMLDPGESNLGACPDRCCAITTIFLSNCHSRHGSGFGLLRDDACPYSEPTPARPAKPERLF